MPAGSCKSVRLPGAKPSWSSVAILPRLAWVARLPGIDNRLQDRRVEYEHAPDTLAMLGRVLQRGMIGAAQIAAEPDEAGVEAVVQAAGACHRERRSG
ncbi:hypothetical protein OKW30_004979 [Paraburkholderia sp. Clong3]|uniref:hypothetical protein n=1 Tax=Paraburkholderia sp. Clong3 TaxID=2991061 RepID=UPI003D1CFF9C